MSFQELYGVLTTKSPDEIADVAKQLRDLPPGIETNAKDRVEAGQVSAGDHNRAYLISIDIDEG